MKFFFDLEDRLGQTVSIQDPVGWDGTTFVLNRDSAGKHGVFFQFQPEPYTYDGEAAQILSKEYETYGVEGVMYLHISYDCGTGVETLDRFRFNFTEFEEIKGSFCSVTMPVEAEDEAAVVFNKSDQKVNLQSLFAFDTITSLPAYNALPFTKTLPSKGIPVSDSASNAVDMQEEYFGHGFGGSSPDVADYMGRQVVFSVPGYAIEIASEIGGFEFQKNSQPNHDEYMEGTGASWSPFPQGFIALPYWINDGVATWDNAWPFDKIPPIVNYDESLGPVFGTLNLTLEGRYRKVYAANTVFGVETSKIERMAVYLGILKANQPPENPSSWNWLSTGGGSHPPDSSTWDIWPFQGAGNGAFGLNGDFNFSFNIALEPGDRIYYFDKAAYRKKDAYQTYSALQITNVRQSFFKLSGISYQAATTAKLFMIYEAFSRVVEAISNDKLRVASYYLGRTDSQPYSVPSDGCAAHFAITMGLFIRQMELAKPATPPIFAVSFKDLWEGFNPLMNMGLSLEADPNRVNRKVIRIEPWWEFYRTDRVLNCIGIEDIRKSVNSEDHVSIFKFGFQKWEAEEFTGLDEFLTNREYRTELTQINKTFSQVSQFIASGYALEVTRRKGNTTSEDWRYDKDNFIVTMKRDSGNVLIPQVGDVGNPSNIIDPATIYNFRIRPAANALQWLPQVLASYKQAGFSSKIIFTDGTGNVYASGYGIGNCILENAALSEKQDLSPNNMATPSEGMPIWDLERVVYQHPLTIPEWKLLRQYPHNRVYFENDQMQGEGWIERIEYKVNDGVANFTLLPVR